MNFKRFAFSVKNGISVLNPRPLKFETMADFKILDDYKKKVISAKDDPEDPEMMLELRRRLIGFVEDMRDFGSL